MTATMTAASARAGATVTNRRELIGWHTDPFGEHKLRYRDANGWSDHTTHFGPVPCNGCGEAHRSQ